MPDCPVVAFDISVLLRLSGLDVLDSDTLLLGPYSELLADVFRAVVDPDRARFSAPFDVEEGQETVRGTVFPTTGPSCG